MAYTVLNGDCIDVMAAMDSDSIDSIVSDPPYGLSFMGKGWDHGVPGEDFWRDALRVAKPGSYLLAFGGTRTYHRLACAIEDAGWEIRDCLGWLYGTGFPKSQNVDGWGTCLKPAWEPIVMARKPFNGTVANNVLTYGTGRINIDASRVTVDDDSYAKNCSGDRGHADNRKRDLGFAMGCGSASAIGRFPANIIHDGSDEILELFPDTKSGKMQPTHTTATRSVFGQNAEGGFTTMETYGDSGSASRFFYCAKASKNDRGEGNTHPTVKPTSLMEYLVRMVTPEGGVVLDPFMGSGSTLKAATRLGFDCIGIDLSAEYCEIARVRIAEVNQ